MPCSERIPTEYTQAYDFELKHGLEAIEILCDISKGIVSKDKFNKWIKTHLEFDEIRKKPFSKEFKMFMERNKL